MPKRAAPRSAEASSSPTDSLEVLQQLAVRLRAGTCEPGHGLPPEGGEVVVDLYVDGLRYTLVRSRRNVQALSPREREIVTLVARGLPNKTIAGILDISLWTVATYMRRLFTKLDVGSRAELVGRALSDGLIDRPN